MIPPPDLPVAAAIAALAGRREAGPLSGTAARMPAKYVYIVYFVRHAVNVNDVNIYAEKWFA